MTGRGLSAPDVDASSRSAEMIEEIARAFGIEPDSLSAIDSDDFVDGAEPHHALADHARRNKELEAALAESRQESERYRQQISDLLERGNSRPQ